VGLDIEGIERSYLQLDQPRLPTGGGVVPFFKEYRGAQVAPPAPMAMTRDVAPAVQVFARRKRARSCASPRVSATTTACGDFPSGVRLRLNGPEYTASPPTTRPPRCASVEVTW
jgi:hypothetical protein